MDPKHPKKDEPTSPEEIKQDETDVRSTEVKNANASGLGSMGGHDEEVLPGKENLSAEDY